MRQVGHWRSVFGTQTGSEEVWWQEQDCCPCFQTRPPHWLGWSHCLNFRDLLLETESPRAINIRTKKETVNIDSATHGSHRWNYAQHLADSAFSIFSIFHSTHHFLLYLIYQQHVFIFQLFFHFLSCAMCNVIADEGSWAETSYIDVILYAMSIKCSKELFS